MIQYSETERYTEEEYLAFERAAELRHEYYNGRISPFARNNHIHSRIKTNISIRIDSGAPDCYVMTSTMRTLAGVSFFYPDVVVVKGKPETRPDGFDDILLNPTAVIEIMSPATRADDMGLKFINYARIPSLADYILVSQSEPRVDHYQRLEDGEWPRSRKLTDPDGVLEIASIGSRITPAEIYKRIEFEE